MILRRKKTSRNARTLNCWDLLSPTVAVRMLKNVMNFILNELFA